MKTAVLKRITMVLFAIICIEGIVLGSLFFTGHDASAKTSIADAVPVMTVVDTLAPPEEPAEQEAIAQIEQEEIEVAYNDNYYVVEDYDGTDEDFYSEEVVSGGASYKKPPKEPYIIDVDPNYLSASDFRTRGVYSDGDWTYTWYSEKVLPGGGLDIPGRHVDEEGYVVDGDGNLCVASDDLPYGTIVNVPFGSGTAVVYDCGGGYGNLDVYVSW